MSKALVWGTAGSKQYETGVSHAALYQKDASGAYTGGVAWTGITGFSPNPTGGDNNALWADNEKYLNLKSVEEFGFSLEAYTYPDEFGQNDGTAELAPGVSLGQQARKPFGLCVRTLLGDDIEGQNKGFKLHLVYGAEANPSSKSYSTVNESPEAVTFSWECVTTPVPVPGFKPTAHIEIDSSKTDEAKMAALLKILYGDDTTEPRLPLPAEIKTLMAIAG